MATQTFSLSGWGVSTSSAATVGSGESVRVRFSAGPVGGDAFLKIVANAVTSYEPITGPNWVTGAAIAADSVSVEFRAGSFGGSAVGIIETFS